MSLIIDNKHLLPKPWYNYPVLKDGNFEEIKLLKKENACKGATIKIGTQDGVWVLGYHFGSGCCNPGRKWGEFKSRQDAISYFVKTKLPELEEYKSRTDKSYSFTNSEIKEIETNMLKLINTQMELF